MVKEYVAGSFHVGKDDFDLAAVHAVGGLRKSHQLSKDDFEKATTEKLTAV